MKQGKIESLQVLRGVAAMMVVAHHAGRAVSIHRPADLVYHGFPERLVDLIDLSAVGVDIFFILSGFLMLHIAAPYFNREESVGNFLLHRVVRIWPLYLIATIAVLAPAVGKFALHGVASYDLTGYRLLGLLFIPTLNAAGEVQPILGVGWTLSYEALFYLAFAAILPFGRRYALVRLAALLLVLHIAGQWMGDSALGQFLRSDLLLEFVAGGIVAALFQHGALRSSFGNGLACILLGFAILIGIALLAPAGLQRALVLGVPACLIFVGFLILDGEVRWSKPSLLLGDASYALYLFHAVVLYRVAQAIMPPLFARGLPEIGMLAAFMASVLASVLLGIAVHLWIERPLQGAILRRLRREPNADVTLTGADAARPRSNASWPSGQGAADRTSRPKKPHAVA